MAIIFLILGMVMGSFLNVCACRIPKGEQFVRGSSCCPYCAKPLKWWQLLPVVSFLLLKGRCAHCGAKISWRYPLVELATGLIYVVLYQRFGLSPMLIPAVFLASLLVVIALIDLDYKIIPNRIVLFGMLAGVPLAWYFGRQSLLAMVAGLLTGGILLLAIAILSKGGLGMGDVKLVALLGIFLGWQQVLQCIFIASMLGAVIGIVLMAAGRAGRKTAIPFGPFLAAGAFIVLVWGPELYNRYWNLFG